MKRLSFLVLAATMSMASAFAEDPYIESLGTSGISTGYRMKGGISRVEVDFQLTTVEASKYIFGASAQENAFQTFYYTTGGTIGLKFGNRVKPSGTVNDEDYVQGTKDLADTRRHVAITDLKNKKLIFQTPDTPADSYVRSFETDFTGYNAAMPLSLFANYNNAKATAFISSSKAKIYSVKIYENYDESADDNSPNLVHNFVPCKKDGKTPCFKDLVGGGFIVPENVTAFKASDNAPTYQDDGYLSTVSETSGEYLYVDTGYQVKNTTRVELDCAVASNRVGMLGWNLFDASNTARFQFNYAYDAGLYYCAKTTSSAVFDSNAFPKPTSVKDVRRTFIMDIPGLAASVVTSGFTNKTMAITGATSYGSGNKSLKIACANADTWAIESSGLAPLKIYGCKIYESGELVHEYVPYVKNGESGLRDTKTGAFVKGKAKTGNAAGTETNLPYGGAIKGEDDAYIVANGSTGMSSGYKMKGVVSRVEVDYALTDVNSGQMRIFGDTSVETSVRTMFYYTGTAGTTGGLYTFRVSAKTGSVHDVQWAGTSAITVDTERHTLVTDLKNGKCQVITGTTVMSGNFVNKSSYVADFTGLTADLPLSLFANYANAAGTSYANPAKARIYSVRFYENYVEGGENTPVRELIPYSRDGVIGFYDTVTGEIVKNDNAAAGAFTFGGAGTDHGALNCYLKPGYATNLAYTATTTLTAYAPGATSYRWYRNGKLVDDDNDGVADGADGVLPVKWMRGGTKEIDGYLHTYQARAVFNMYGVERKSEPSAVAEVKCRRIGMMVIFK